MSLVLLFALPGLVALALWLVTPSADVSRRISLGVGVGLAAFSLWLVQETAGGAIPAHAFGGWKPPFGIAFAADRLSALFIALHAVLLCVALVALRRESHGEMVLRRAHPLLFVLTMGLFGSFLTADLFDLFVMFELVLVASYLLLQVPGTRRSLAATLPAVVINLLASVLFLAGLGILYGITGSTSIEDLRSDLIDAPVELRRVALTMLVLAFATKSALVPLCFWMPATYPTLSAPLAALFAGIMTKLGVYALLRIMPLVTLDPLLPEILVWAGAISALLGVLGALGQYEMRRLLAFHSVSQVGYLVVALGLGSVVGLGAAIFFALHHSVVKSALYFIADDLERRNGSRDLRRMDFRLAAGTPAAACFVVAAFSLAGMPPFSGFFGKVTVFQAVFDGGAWPAMVLLALASPLTLASMLKIWGFAFQRTPQGDAKAADPPRSAAGALFAMMFLVLALGVGAGVVQDYATDAAEGLLDGRAYSEAIDTLPGYPPLEESY